jgi:outer membrane protein assembly factor BamE
MQRMKSLSVVRSLFGLVAVASLLAGCSNFGVYRLDVQQGNLVTQEQVGRVKTGMSRLDVRNILGTPLLQDAFNGNRWDFYYSDDRNADTSVKLLANPYARTQQTFKVSIVFDQEKVARIDGVASPIEILTGGGERRKTPDATMPGAPADPKKQP